MDKNQLLQTIQIASESGSISREELIHAFEQGQATKKDSALTKPLNIAEVLYYIGGIIIFVGVMILIAQHWIELNTFTRILVTLGSAIAAYVTGAIFTKYEKFEPLSHVFFLISALLSPLGLSIFMNEVKISLSFIQTQVLISSILMITYLLSYYFFKKVLFIIFAVIFGTWFFFSLTNLMLQDNPLVTTLHLNEYRFLFTGLSYILLGYFFSKREEHSLSDPLYGFGVIAFLGASFALGGYSPKQNMFWELIFPLINFAVIYLSVYLKSRAFLTFGTIYLMVYIGKITAEYFSSSLGWPISLMIAGLTIIFLAFTSFNLHKKYLQKSI